MLDLAKRDDVAIVFGSRFLDDRTEPRLGQARRAEDRRMGHQPHDRACGSPMRTTGSA